MSELEGQTAIITGSGRGIGRAIALAFAESERVKLPEEVAPLALFLASQPAGGPTGQSFSLARRPV